MAPGGEGREVPPGIVLKEAHYPGRAPVDAYGAGGFRFADMSHRGSILCVPSGIYAWTPERPKDLDTDAFARVVAEAEEIELLLVGMGALPFPLPQPVSETLREAAVRFEVMPTGSAVRTFNVLLAEERRVAAALLAVE
ncbi:Mth938-like domain-containing protein [Amorphus sp. 3PC139-8]|uniref:Mth938-like domain-containing protein n=1 Tax=Amorphus sp. 3PC139-8 TaxID=2735676 RepID=UPI00345CF496